MPGMTSGSVHVNQPLSNLARLYRPDPAEMVADLVCPPSPSSMRAISTTSGPKETCTAPMSQTSSLTVPSREPSSSQPRHSPTRHAGVNWPGTSQTANARTPTTSSASSR
jgi:hypothetical protein